MQKRQHGHRNTKKATTHAMCTARYSLGETPKWGQELLRHRCFQRFFADLQYHDKEMGTITLLALFSFTLREDTFSAARVGSSMHSNLRMHHMSGDSPNHQTWFSTREIHEMRIRLWDNRFMAIFYRIQWGFTKCEVRAMSTPKKILLVSKAAALKKTLLQDTTTVGYRQRKFEKQHIAISLLLT